MSFKIGNFTIETQKIFDILKKAEIKTDDELKMLDANGDKTISEDEFVDVTNLIEDENEDKKTNSTSLNSNTENQLLALYEQLDNLMETRRKIANQLGVASDLEEAKSIQSQMQNCNSQIQSLRDQIYQVYFNAELQAANSAKSAAINSTTASNTVQNTAQGATSSYTYSGNSAEFVNAFNNSSFQKGVLAGQGEMVAGIAEKYGLDPNLLASIMALETGWGTSSAIKNYNNPGGMMDPSSNWMSLIHYSSLEQGIEAVAKNLKNNYIDKGLTTISSIGAKYCPVGAANDPNGTNSGWVPSVTKIYNMLTGANIDANTKIA